MRDHTITIRTSAAVVAALKDHAEAEGLRSASGAAHALLESWTNSAAHIYIIGRPGYEPFDEVCTVHLARESAREAGAQGLDGVVITRDDGQLVDPYHRPTLCQVLDDRSEGGGRDMVEAIEDTIASLDGKNDARLSAVLATQIADLASATGYTFTL